MPAVIFGDELADAHLHRHIQADRRLVQEEHLWAVQQRSGELALHTFAERQLAHLLLHQRPQLQEVVQLLQRGLVFGLGDFIDGLIDQEGLDRR
jgi:hypothetical protein